MTPSARPGVRTEGQPSPAGAAWAQPRPLAVTGAMAACAVAVVGLVILTPLVLAGWIAAPHARAGLPGVLRTATALWLAAHHVTITVRGVGRVGMLPLGLTLLPGALLWRAGRWVVRTGRVSRLPEAGYAAVALAAPYAVVCGALALAGRSALTVPSLPEAVGFGFVLAMCAGGLGGARELAPWGTLARLLPPRPRSLVLATAGALTVLTVVGATLAGASLAVHLGEFRSLSREVGAGTVGSGLLLLAELAYVPNAVGWAVSFTLGPGFAFGAGTVVAPTGVALGPLPMFPLLAAVPAGAHEVVPGWVSATVLATPYLAGAFAGLLLVRAAPAVTSLEIMPLWGFVCGVATGCVTGGLAAFAGGPLGSGRLVAVGPSGWQAGVVAALQVGVAAAVVAGAANWMRLRRGEIPVTGDPGAVGGPLTPAATAHRQAGPRGPATVAGARAGGDAPPDPGRAGPRDADGHHIYLDPWGERTEPGEGDLPGGPPLPGPSELPPGPG